jgi:hypothetical protein
MSSFGLGPFAPNTLSQSILPGWGAFNMTVNYQGSPDIETEVVRDVASFGRQIGWLSEVVLELCKTHPPQGAAKDAEVKLQEAAKRIKAIKDRREESARIEATEALERFRKEHPQRYALFLRDKAAELQAAESKGKPV